MEKGFPSLVTDFYSKRRAAPAQRVIAIASAAKQSRKKPRHCDCKARSRQQSGKPLFPRAPLVAQAIPPPLPLIPLLQIFNKGIREKLGAFKSTKGACGNKGSLAFSLNLMTLGRASSQREKK